MFRSPTRSSGYLHRYGYDDGLSRAEVTWERVENLLVLIKDEMPKNEPKWSQVLHEMTG